MKRQMVLALIALLLIPAVVTAGGFFAGLINPEIAVHSANYSRNFRLLMLAKGVIFLGSIAIGGILWLVSCFLILRSKEQSLWWMVCAIFGPFGFAMLAMLNDR